jgi:hypothetical protein
LPGKEVRTGRDEVGYGMTTAEMHAEVAQRSDFSCREHHFLRNMHTDNNNNNNNTYHRGPEEIQPLDSSENENIDITILTPIIGNLQQQHLGNPTTITILNDEEEKSDLARNLASWKNMCMSGTTHIGLVHFPGFSSNTPHSTSTFAAMWVCLSAATSEKTSVGRQEGGIAKDREVFGPS